MSVPGRNADWQQAWTAALDELELDVAAVEAILTDAHRAQDLPLADPWSPPAGLGPLPLDLRPRADAILERQLAAAVAVTRALATTRRQAAMAARIDTGRDAARPAYLDCAL
jgi:hypothetical protein